MNILGIDVGGSGIKGALVDLESGEFATDRVRIPTPQPATPEAVIDVMAEMVRHFDYRGPLGVGFPAISINGVTHSAANVDDRWIGFPAAERIGVATGCTVTLRNDADVAGMAEMRYGAGKDQGGTVMIFTLGTGIGSAMFVNGRLVPNTELGHLFLEGQVGEDAEDYAAERIREEQGLSWKKWGRRLNKYFQHVEFLFSPELIIIGGGVSKKAHKYLPHIETRANIVPAQLQNQAGIVGAALAAVDSD